MRLFTLLIRLCANIVAKCGVKFANVSFTAASGVLLAVIMSLRYTLMNWTIYLTLWIFIKSYILILRTKLASIPGLRLESQTFPNVDINCTPGSNFYSTLSFLIGAAPSQTLHFMSGAASRLSRSLLSFQQEDIWQEKALADTHFRKKMLILNTTCPTLEDFLLKTCKKFIHETLFFQ